jgi:hypothetical protein
MVRLLRHVGRLTPAVLAVVVVLTAFSPLYPVGGPREAGEL